jgi:hypothetical protein
MHCIELCLESFEVPKDEIAHVNGTVTRLCKLAYNYTGPGNYR